MDDLFLSMYLDFRRTIDTLAFSKLKEWSNTGFQPILFEGNPVGFIMVLQGCVEAIYVQPDYRKKGLARKAVFDYINNIGKINTLYIVNNNEQAKQFWHSVLILEVLDSSPVDTLYRIKGVRQSTPN